MWTGLRPSEMAHLKLEDDTALKAAARETEAAFTKVTRRSRRHATEQMSSDVQHPVVFPRGLGGRGRSKATTGAPIENKIKRNNAVTDKAENSISPPSQKKAAKSSSPPP